MDLIRRQDAIDAVETIGFDFSNCDLSQTEREELCEAIGEVRQTFVRRISNVTPAQQWIPCSERLPEEEGQYLVTLDFSWGKEIEMGDWFIFEDGHGEWVNPNSHVTVAWMELPTPWKESEE